MAQDQLPQSAHGRPSPRPLWSGLPRGRTGPHASPIRSTCPRGSDAMHPGRTSIRPEVVDGDRGGRDRPSVGAPGARGGRHALRGESVVVATGTASGKSLAYLAPVLSALLDGADAARRSARAAGGQSRERRGGTAAERAGGPSGIGRRGRGRRSRRPSGPRRRGRRRAGSAPGPCRRTGELSRAGAGAGWERGRARGATALYLAPTKALAADQRRAVSALAAPLGTAVRPAVYDGDTPFEEREWVRQHATYVLTNPDMLHRGILPGHARWASFLRQSALCRDRRVPHLPRRVRLARRPGAAPAAAGVRPLRRRARSSCSPRPPPPTRRGRPNG